jgi:hypothetical protein
MPETIMPECHTHTYWPCIGAATCYCFTFHIMPESTTDCLSLLSEKLNHIFFVEGALFLKGQLNHTASVLKNLTFRTRFGLNIGNLNHQ